MKSPCICWFPEIAESPQRPGERINGFSGSSDFVLTLIFCAENKVPDRAADKKSRAFSSSGLGSILPLSRSMVRI